MKIITLKQKQDYKSIRYSIGWNDRNQAGCFGMTSNKNGNRRASLNVTDYYLDVSKRRIFSKIKASKD